MNDTPFGEILERIREINSKIESRLRERSHAAVIRKHGPLILDTLSGKQIRLIHAVRQYLQDKPDGLLLRDLAERIGVTPPSASVMVDTLVKRGFLERSISVDDRRAVRIRLTPLLNEHFDALHQARVIELQHLAENLGEKTLHNWLAVLLQVDAQLTRDLPPAETNLNRESKP